MADTIREQIIDKVRDKLVLISVAGGFETNVKAVYRAGVEPVDTQVAPSIVIHDTGDGPRRFMIRLAYECTLRLVLRCTIAHDVDESRANNLSKLVGDVIKQMVANATWDGLAIATIMEASNPAQGQAVRPLGVDEVTANITYRVKVGDPYTLQTI